MSYETIKGAISDLISLLFTQLMRINDKEGESLIMTLIFQF